MYGNQPVNFTLVAKEDFYQYHLIFSSGDTINGGLAVAATVNIRGVAQNGGLAGDHITVCPFGLSRVIAGGAISLDARLTCNASARADAAGSGDIIIGYAWQAALADGDIITAWIAANGDKMVA
jgi:hypothetical protein